MTFEPVDHGLVHFALGGSRREQVVAARYRDQLVVHACRGERVMPGVSLPGTWPPSVEISSMGLRKCWSRVTGEASAQRCVWPTHRCPASWRALLALRIQKPQVGDAFAADSGAEPVVAGDHTAADIATVAVAHQDQRLGSAMPPDVSEALLPDLGDLGIRVRESAAVERLPQPGGRRSLRSGSRARTRRSPLTPIRTCRGAHRRRVRPPGRRAGTPAVDAAQVPTGRQTALRVRRLRGSSSLAAPWPCPLSGVCRAPDLRPLDAPGPATLTRRRRPGWRRRRWHLAPGPATGSWPRRVVTTIGSSRRAG